MDAHDAIRKYFIMIGKTICLSSKDEQIPIGIRKAMAQLKGSLGPTITNLVCSFHLIDRVAYWQVGYMNPNYNNPYDYKTSVDSKALEGKWKGIQPIDIRYKIDNEERIFSIAEFMLLEGLFCQASKPKS